MEKSVEFGLEHYIENMPGMGKTDVKTYSPLALAFIGDCVFDLIIKSLVISRGNRQVHRLHEETSHYVQASSQSFMMRAIQEHLTEEEHVIYRRGRNTRSADSREKPVDYRLPARHRVRGADRLSVSSPGVCPADRSWFPSV